MAGMSTDARRRRKRVTGRTLAGRIALGAVVALVVGIVAVVAWVGVRAVQALPHIERAQQLATGLDMQRLLAGDTAELDELQRELAATREHTSDPVWRVAEGLPWIGPQLHAASTLTAALDDVAGSAMSTVAIATAEGAEALLPRDGRIDLAALDGMHAEIDAARATVGDARERIEGIETAALVRPLREATTTVDGMLAEIEPTLDGVGRATELLPSFLGADGPREHLLLLQNNAEWRSLGGIVGSVIHIRAADGQIDFTGQRSTADFPRNDGPIAPFSFDAQVIYGDRPAQWMQNPTMLPDYPEAASLARAFWQSQNGGDPRGVIAIDPVALSYILEATGPIALPTGEQLTSENAVQLLLNEVYLRYEDPREQDLFFAAAAGAVFDGLIQGRADPAAALQGIGRAIEERRLLVWSADPAEQALLEGTAVEGELPESDAERTTFGVFLNDGVGAKLDYYVAAGSAAHWCGDGTAALRVELRNDAPGDIRDYPDYLVGTDGEFTASGAPRGIARTLTYVYLPAGSELVSGGDAAGLKHVGRHSGLDVYEWTTDLAPGEATALDLRVRATTGSELTVRSTPVIHPIDVAGSAC